MAPNPLGAVRLVPINQLKPYPRNPRKVPAKAVEQCAASISEFGWQQPIVADPDMVIIAGHTRYAAAKHLGLAEVPVVVADNLTPAQVRAFRIADNRTHDYTAWDYPQLMAELNGLDDDFAKVLDLADWQDIITQFNDAKDESALGFDDPETIAGLTPEHSLSVTFDSKENADKAGPGILDMPGVTNVTYSRK